MRPIPLAWYEPPWSAPLDGDALVRMIPADATMTGVFLAGVADLGKQCGVRLTKARERYTPFQPYPLREHSELLLEVSRVAFPNAPLREALRKIGRGAPSVLLRSTVGRVVLGSAEGPLDVLHAMAKSYALHMRPCSLEVLDAGPARAIVRLSQVHNFLDCHNVGVFEGCQPGSSMSTVTPRLPRSDPQTGRDRVDFRRIEAASPSGRYVTKGWAKVAAGPTSTASATL